MSKPKLNRAVALMSLCILTLLMGCAPSRIVEKPVPVTIEVTKYREFPAGLTQTAPVSSIPDDLTYSQALALWAADRASLITANARLRGIQEVSGGER